MNAGKLQEALTDFEQALAIDPSSFIAQQQSNKIRLMIKQSLNPTARRPAQHGNRADAPHGRGYRSG